MRKKRYLCFLGIGLLLGLIFVQINAKGQEEMSFRTWFEDGSEATYVTEKRVLWIENMVSKDDAEGENPSEEIENQPEDTKNEIEEIQVFVNEEEMPIKWQENGIGCVTFSDQGKYDVTIQRGEEEITYPTFYIELDNPTLPYADLGNYKENTWTKENVNIKLSGSESFTGIDAYEMRIGSHTWKKFNGNMVELNKTMDEEVFFRSISKAGRKSEIISVKIRIWKQAPQKVSVHIVSENARGWYQKLPSIEVKIPQDEGPRIHGYFKLENKETGKSRIFKDESPVIDSDGIYELTGWAENELGVSCESVKLNDIKVDRVKPVIEMKHSIKQEYQKEQVTITFDVEDQHLSKDELQIDTSGDVSMHENEYRVSFQKEGVQHLKIVAMDEAGNQQEQEIKTFVLDQTSPKIKIQNIKPLESYQEAKDVSVIIQDMYLNPNNCHIYLDHKEVSNSMSLQEDAINWNMKIEKDAHHVMEMIAEDMAGNKNQIQIPFTINQEGSKIRFLQEKLIGNVTNQKNLKLGFQIDNIDPVIITRFQVNGENISYQRNGKEVWTQEALQKDGEYQVEFQVRDATGNVNEYQKPIHFTLDYTPPYIMILGAKDQETYYTSKTVKIKTQKESDRITHILYNEKPVKIQGALTKIRCKKKTNKIEVEAIDAAGNVMKQTVVFTIRENPIKIVQDQIEKITPQKNIEEITPKAIDTKTVFLGCSGMLFGIILLWKIKKQVKIL